MLTISIGGSLITTKKDLPKDLKIWGDFPYKPFDTVINLPEEKSLTMKLRFTPPDIKGNTRKHDESFVFDVNNEYMRSLGSMFVATVKCGIDSKTLEITENTVMGGLLKYHIILTFQLMFQNPNLLKQELTKDDIEIILRSIPKNITWDMKDIPTSEAPGNWIIQDGIVRIDKNYMKYVTFYTKPSDYLHMIQDHGEGITNFGVLKLSDTALSFMYCILLAQGKTGFPISNGTSGMVGLTQQEFRRLHNIRVNSGTVGQNIQDVKNAMFLISRKTTSWTDIARGVVRIPNTLTLFKLTKKGNSLVTQPLNIFSKEVMDSESEDSESEDEESESEESESEDEQPSNNFVIPVVVVLGFVGIGLKLINGKCKR